MNNNIKKLVAFCILMESSNDGILSKAPSYIQEKYEACLSCKEDWQLRALLDMGNKAKFDRWVERWT